MFTGLVTDIGTVRAIEPRAGSSDMGLEIATSWPTADIAIGASIACSGCCLTVVSRGEGWMGFQTSGETLSRTTLGGWAAGTRVNLERSLRLGDELGGHLVYGHVDATGSLVSATPDGGSLRLVFALGGGLGRFVAAKGSIAVDGVSLTVNSVEDDAARRQARFGVNVIPHTRDATTLGTLVPGQSVNVEVDMLARYVARLGEAG
ncbi:MAG: riboflavin synthase [Alphaproteobacteria bacterium]